MVSLSMRFSNISLVRLLQYTVLMIFASNMETTSCQLGGTYTELTLQRMDVAESIKYD